MANFQLNLLSAEQARLLHGSSLAVLRDTGVRVLHPGSLRRLAEAGAHVDFASQLARMDEALVQASLDLAAKQCILRGREPRCVARLGYGDKVLISSPGQRVWIDDQTGEPRAPTLADARNAIRLGDRLGNVDIVGALAQPAEVPAAVRDVVLAGELVKGAAKPTLTWVHDRLAANHVLEMYRLVAGGSDALRRQPMLMAFLEPISPLQFPHDSVAQALMLAGAGQPVSINPMPMATGTGPATLAGTLALANAEILAGIVIIEQQFPGTAIIYGGIPHILDPRSSQCSFGSPEQGIMAVAMVQMARFYQLPAYVNVGLTDAKVLDAQAGIEKAASLVLGALAGADTFGHAGICGADQGASLEWLAADNTIMAFVKRLLRGIDTSIEAFAADIIGAVGPGGNFLAEPHTAKHFRNEIWPASALWDRQAWNSWAEEGRHSMADRARLEVRQMLDEPPPPVDESLAREVDRVIRCASRELQ